MSRSRRNTFAASAQSHRPSQLENDAALFEADLRDIFIIWPNTNTRLDDIHLSDEEFYNMNETASHLLDSLETLVNQDLISHMEPPENAEVLRHDILILGDGRPHLQCLLRLLDSTFAEPSRYNLVSGSGPVIFTLAAGDASATARSRAREWKAFLNTLTVKQYNASNFHSDPLHQGALVSEPPLDEKAFLLKRASTTVRTILKEFESHCDRVHDVRLNVSDALYTTSTAHTRLDMKLSCCQSDMQAYWPVRCDQLLYALPM